MKYQNIHIISLIFCLFFGSCKYENNKIIGVKIYDYKGNYFTLADKWNDMGINTAFVSTSLAANDTFRQAMKKHNIPVFIIFPVFQNPEALHLDTSLYAITNKGNRAKDDWVEFICPSRAGYRHMKIMELAELVQKLKPDGISIDFIRQFVFWEMVYPDRDPESIDRACFCNSCLEGFERKQGINIPDTCRTTIQKASYVNSNYAVQYDAYRCDLIALMVRELSETAKIIKPDVKINVHIVPWRESDFNRANIRIAAQDLQKIAPNADYVSPMCYSQMLKRDADWIKDVVADMNRRAPGKVLPSIQVYPYYINWPFTAEDFRSCIKQALKPPSRGVVFWSWPLLEKDWTRMKVVGEEMSN